MSERENHGAARDAARLAELEARFAARQNDDDLMLRSNLAAYRQRVARHVPATSPAASLPANVTAAEIAAAVAAASAPAKPQAAPMPPKPAEDRITRLQRLAEAHGASQAELNAAVAGGLMPDAFAVKLAEAVAVERTAARIAGTAYAPTRTRLALPVVSGEAAEAARIAARIVASDVDEPDADSADAIAARIADRIVASDESDADSADAVAARIAAA